MNSTFADGGDAENKQKPQRVPDMLELNRFFVAGKEGTLDFAEIAAALPKSVREKIISGFDMKNFARIFEDEAMMQTVEAYFENGMNVCATARALYMHRNTLMYRLKTVRRVTGLDISVFDMACTFKLLYCFYILR